MLFSDKQRAYLFVILGASLWGIIALFVNELTRLGFSTLQIVTLRMVCAAVMLLIYLAYKKPRLLIIDWKDSISFIGTGIFSMVFFNWCYFTAIKEISLSIAVILLYTGPLFVAILSRIFFGEPFTGKKLGSLVITLLGCTLVIEVIPFNGQQISFYGLIVGLGSGFGYALYSIFGKHALQKYSTLTVITYTFVFASLVMIPSSGMTLELVQLSSGYVWMLIFGLGFFPTVMAYLLYTRGLAIIESSRASIAATVEPVVATLVGVSVFNEVLTVYQIIGILLVLAAVVLIQQKTEAVPVT